MQQISFVSQTKLLRTSAPKAGNDRLITIGTTTSEGNLPVPCKCTFTQFDVEARAEASSSLQMSAAGAQNQGHQIGQHQSRHGGFCLGYGTGDRMVDLSTPREEKQQPMTRASQIKQELKKLHQILSLSS